MSSSRPTRRVALRSSVALASCRSGTTAGKPSGHKRRAQPPCADAHEHGVDPRETGSGLAALVVEGGSDPSTHELPGMSSRHAAEAPAMLARLQQAVIDNGNVFAVLMDAVRVCSLVSMRP